MPILSAVEQDRFECPPTFDSTEQKQFFDFPRSAMNVAQELRSPENQIGFLLTYGYAEKSDQEIAEGCNRLIRNSIIWRNYLSLTQKITLAKSQEERKRLLDIIETHSPQSWASFNMLGEFDFSGEKLQDTTSVLPPKKQIEIIPENWEARN